jgi:small-conductance mechanosensitive channel
MDEQDLPEIAAGHLAPEVAERVRAVLSAAEAAAGAVRHEADRAAHTRRRMAEEEAQRYLDEAKREADAYLQERLKRISELSDGILERAESIVARLDRAEEVRRQLQGLVISLGETAEQLAADAAASYPRAKPIGSDREPAVREPEPEPEPEPVAETEPVFEPEPVAEEPPPVRVAPEPEPDDAEVVELPRSEQPAPARETDDDQLAARLVALQMAVAGADRGEVEAHLRVNFDIGDTTSILDDVFGRGSGSSKRVTWPEAAGDGNS